MLYFLIAVVVGLVVTFAVVSRQSTSSTPSSGAVELTGVVECLPKPGNGPQTLECAYGIKTSDNKHYALRNVEQSMINYPVGTEVVVKGELSPPPTDTVYDINGVINVTAFSKPDAKQ